MASNIRISKVCVLCGCKFIAKTTTTRYCSHACSSKAYKQRKREKNFPELKQEQFEDTIIQNKLNPNKDPINLNREYLNIQQLADLLGVERTTAYRYCAHNKIKSIVLNRKIYVRKKDVDSLFENAVPYVVKSPPKLDTTNFYTISEIEEKYKNSEPLIYTFLKSKEIKKKVHKGEIIYNKKQVDEYFSIAIKKIGVGEQSVKEKNNLQNDNKELMPTFSDIIKEFYTIKEIEEKYKISKSTIYSIIRKKNIPKKLYRGATICSRKHVDKYFSLYEQDTTIKEWYSIEDIKKEYDLTTTAVYSLVCENVVPRKKENGKAYYSKEHIDSLLLSKKPDGSIKEWYSMQDIEDKYKLDPKYVATFVWRNPIPKMRRGNKAYYSKVHFDQLMKEKLPIPEYYSVPEAMDKFNLSRDALYHYIKAHNISKKKEGKYIKISKHQLDTLFEKKIII